MEVRSVYQIYGFQMNNVRPISGFQQDSIKNDYMHMPLFRKSLRHCYYFIYLYYTG